MKTITQSLKTVALALTLALGVSYVSAWTEPTIAPTGGNTAAPLNTSANTQYKAGTLGVDLFRSFGNLIVDGNVGVGTATPGAKLSIVNGQQYINFTTGSNTSGYTLGIGVNDDGVNFENNSLVRGFNFKNTNGTLATITSSGNVGVGTISPGAKLDVNGRIRFSPGGPYIYGPMTRSGQTTCPSNAYMCGINRSPVGNWDNTQIVCCNFWD